jgi:hypothetical protein
MEHDYMATGSVVDFKPAHHGLDDWPVSVVIHDQEISEQRELDRIEKRLRREQQLIADLAARLDAVYEQRRKLMLLQIGITGVTALLAVVLLVSTLMGK